MNKCCFCKKIIKGYGNNAEPVMRGRCCEDCDYGIVIPIRILRNVDSPILKLGELNKLAREHFKK